MEFAVFIGSLHPNSYNRKVYNAYRSIVGSEHKFVEIPTADFPHYSIEVPIENLSIVHDSANNIAQSNGVLFFSPEYSYSIPGHLKNAIDWLSRLKPQPFDNKKAALFGASPGNIGTARMQYHLRQVGTFLNLHFLNKPEVMVGQVHTKFNDKGELIDEKTQAFLQHHWEQFKTVLST